MLQSDNPAAHNQPDTERVTTDTVIGQVASPPRKEATSEEFFFWIRDDVLVERGQIVVTELLHEGRTIRFYAMVEEVYRQSRLRSLAEARDRQDGDTNYQPPFELPSVMFAEAAVMRTRPDVACPPADGTLVYLASETDAEFAFGADEIEHPLEIGLVKNGGQATCGAGAIDLDYVLGANGGHVNVTGVAGRGTKSSFLLHLGALLLREAERQKRERPSDPDRLKVVPLILNVKNLDLFHIDATSSRFQPSEHAADWQKLGIDDPQPFANVRYLAAQLPHGQNPVDTGRTTGDVQPYSFSLADIIERGLFRYLFAADDIGDDNFAVLALSVEDWLTQERTGGDGAVARSLKDQRPATFDELLQNIDGWAGGSNGTPFGGSHHAATIRKFHRRLNKLVLEGQGVLRRSDRHGNPLDLIATETAAPTVIDLSSLAHLPSLQRFVAATIFRSLVENRTGSRAVRGLVYLVTLDELNRFAPKNAKDPITRLVEQVAAEMRSQGIILLGAQQQASLVSSRVIENAGLRVLGKSGSLELGERVWRFLSPSAKSRAMQLRPDEKLLIQDGFREPMLVRIPFPPWALRSQEAIREEVEIHPDENPFDAP